MTLRNGFPIVLAHGICRFDQLLNETFGLDNKDDDSRHYFKRIRSTLMTAGFKVWHSKVSWSAGVDLRADQLKAELFRLTNEFKDCRKVHLIAHSMGGLDARHMIYEHKMDDFIASLTTIGTPHRGTSFADWGVKRAGRMIPFLEALGIDITGFLDLTTERCNAFNAKAEDFESRNSVKYQSFAGIQERKRTFWPLQFPHSIISDEEGDNDGLVSVESARWRSDFFVKKIDADHLNEVGWCDINEPEYLFTRDAFEQRIRDFYCDIAQSLPVE